MSYTTIKRALHTKGHCRRVVDFGDDFDCPVSGSRCMYSLKEMACTDNSEIIDLRFFKGEKIRFRAENNKTMSKSIDVALNDQRANWLLDGYHVTSDGLVLELLPKADKSLASQANQILQQAARYSRSDYERLVQDGEAKVRKTFLRRIYVTGTFEAWENLAEGDAVAISVTPQRILVYEVEDEVKIRKTIIDPTGKTEPRYYVFD